MEIKFVLEPNFPATRVELSSIQTLLRPRLFVMRQSACVAPLVTGRPEVHYIREFEVRGAPATARQQACCPGPFLSRTWYDAATDTTYRLQLSMQAALLGSDTTLSDLGASASKLADLAGALIPLR